MVMDGLKPGLLMVVVQIAFAGVNVLYKIVAYDGTSLRIIIAYRLIFATAFILPLALFIERKERPKLTWRVLFLCFLSGLFGATLAQNLYLESLALTSATYASAMSNLIPAITYILAVSFRLERMNLRKLAGKGKACGALMGIGGAILLTLYKGVELDIWNTHINLSHRTSSQVASSSAPPHAQAATNRILGCLMSVGSGTSYALWLIIQAKVDERYPCHYSSTALMSMMGSIQCVIFALFTEKDLTQWKLSWDVKLLTVAYSGIVASGAMITIITWCVHERGPLFVSVFNPLMLFFVALAGSLVLNEKLHLGTVLAAVLIVLGLYLVLWGKSKETKEMSQLAPSESFHELPLQSIDIVVRQQSDHHQDNKINTTNIRAIR